MLIFKKASETASVLSPKKGGWDFSFSYFAFQTWRHINTFFFNKRMCLLSLGMAMRQRRSQCVEGREGRWLMEHSSHWKEIQAEGLQGLSKAPPSQRRQWDLISDRVRIPFSRNFVAGPQFLLSSSPVWDWLALVAEPAMQVSAWQTQKWDPAWHPLRTHSWETTWSQSAQ